MALMQSEEFALDVGNEKVILGAVNISFVVNGNDFGFGTINDIFRFVSDVDFVAERQNFRASEKRARRFAETLGVIDVDLFARIAIAVIFRKSSHG